MLSTNAKIVKIGWDMTKLQRVSRWELFLRHSVETNCILHRPVGAEPGLETGTWAV